MEWRQAVNMHYPSRNESPQSWFRDHQGYYSHHRTRGKGCPHLDFKGQDYHPAEPPGQGPCKKLHRQGSTRAKRQGHPIEPWAWCHNHPHGMSREGGTGAPVCVDGWASNQRGLICHGICSATYCTFLRTNTPFFLPISPFGNEDNYLMAIPPLCFGST